MLPKRVGLEQAQEVLRHMQYVTVADFGTTTLIFNGNMIGLEHH